MSSNHKKLQSFYNPKEKKPTCTKQYISSFFLAESLTFNFRVAYIVFKSSFGGEATICLVEKENSLHSPFIKPGNYVFLYKKIK